MVDLPRAVQDLVDATPSETHPRALKGTVENLLEAFERAPQAPRRAAIRALGRALESAEGKSAQVLCLALGALVEGGASPELAWPSIVRDLRTMLDGATAFAAAVVKRAKEPRVDVAIESVGSEVARKKPREADAWNTLPSRCLAAVACLTRSKKLRSNARKDVALQEAAWPLSDAISEVGSLLQALRLVDDETLLVLAPDAGRGWRVAIDAMPSNADLYVLLGDALVGDPKKGRLAGRRPDPDAVAALRRGIMPKRVSSVTLPFHLVAWTAIEPSGSLPPSSASETDHILWPEGIPGDIPKFGNEHVVVLQRTSSPKPTPIAPSFEGLKPDLRVTAELSFDDVERTMKKLGKASAKLRMVNAAPSSPTKGAIEKATPTKTGKKTTTRRKKAKTRPTLG